MASIFSVLLFLLILSVHIWGFKDENKMKRLDPHKDDIRPETGIGSLQEKELESVRINTNIEEIAIVGKKKIPSFLLDQNDDADGGGPELVVVDEGEAKKKKEPKKFAKLGTPKSEKNADSKSQKSDAKSPMKGAETATTATTTKTTATMSLMSATPSSEGPKKMDKGEASGTAVSESKSQAKSAPPPALPQGPPMPPPSAPIPAPEPPQQNVITPAKQSNGLALPMPGGVGGKLPNYKLIYFDARGICEPIRLIFHYTKVPFDDVRISRKQWLALKDSTVYGKVPILEVDGKPLTYCHTIARYLARNFGLAGRDMWDQAKVDEVADFHADAAMDLQPYMYVMAGFHQGDKQSLRNGIFLPNVEKHFPVYVSLLKQSGSGFFSPSGITWVDFVISEYMVTVRNFEPQILDKYPAIIKFIRKVQTQPQIFDYITNRDHHPV